MIVTSTPVDLVLPPLSAPRTPGVHLSKIIRAIATETGILTPDREEDTSIVERGDESAAWWGNLPVAAKTRICMGLAWEEWYIHTQLPSAINHPGELELDGVYMTPDAEELTTYVVGPRRRSRVVLSEVKLTYKSLKTVVGGEWSKWTGRPFDSTNPRTPVGPLSSQWMWLAQTKGYAKVAGTRFVDLHVLFACGDYSWPQRPIPYRYAIEFTQAELDANWQTMTEYRDHVLELT